MQSELDLMLIESLNKTVRKLEVDNKELRSKLREIAAIAYQRGGAPGRNQGKLTRIKAIVVDFREKP